MPRRKKIDLPKLDPVAAMAEAEANAREGNLKLAKAVDILRAGLELISQAEYDHEAGKPVGPKELRQMAVSVLDQYSSLVGQSWRSNPLRGNYAGGTGNRPVHERDM